MPRRGRVDEGVEARIPISLHRIRGAHITDVPAGVLDVVSEEDVPDWIEVRVPPPCVPTLGPLVKVVVPADEKLPLQSSTTFDVDLGAVVRVKAVGGRS